MINTSRGEKLSRILLPQANISENILLPVHIPFTPCELFSSSSSSPGTGAVLAHPAKTAGWVQWGPHLSTSPAGCWEQLFKENQRKDTHSEMLCRAGSWRSWFLYLVITCVFVFMSMPHRLGHLLLDQVVQRPIQADLEHFQGHGTHNFSGPVPMFHHPHHKRKVTMQSWAR